VQVQFFLFLNTGMGTNNFILYPNPINHWLRELSSVGKDNVLICARFGVQTPATTKKNPTQPL